MSHDIQDLANDPVWDEIKHLFDASKKNKSNARLATLKGVEAAQNTGRAIGEDLISSVYNLNEREHSFVPEGGFCSGNVRNNIVRYENNGVLQDGSYLLNERGVQLLDFVDSVEETLQSEQNFKNAASDSVSDFSKILAEKMGQPNAQEDVEKYISNFINFDEIDCNPLSDADYTVPAADKLTVISGDRLKGFLALAEDPNVTYQEVGNATNKASETVSGWVRGYRTERLMKSYSRELTPIGSEIKKSIEDFYQEVE